VISQNVILSSDVMEVHSGAVNKTILTYNAEYLKQLQSDKTDNILTPYNSPQDCRLNMSSICGLAISNKKFVFLSALPLHMHRR
jgi:hypothetical protein